MDRTDSKAERAFFRIAALATALALGTLLSAVASLDRDSAGFSFRVSARTLAGFVIGAVLGLVYWKLIAPGSDASRSPAWVRRAASLGLLLVGVAAFVYPIRFLPKAALPEVFIGLIGAAVVLSAGAFLLWRIKGFLDRDSQPDQSIMTDHAAAADPSRREGDET